MSNVSDFKLALHGGTPVRTPGQPWPEWPVHDQREREAVLPVLESGAWFYGEQVAAFEREFAAFQGAAHCVSCSNGTAALEVVLEALGVGRGDEVIVPPYTFVATASAVMRVGANPVFVDVDNTWCLDARRVADAVTEVTKAIIVVHFGGCIANMDALRALSQRRGLHLVEDAAHAWGSSWENQGAGTLGCCGTFSFQQSKNMTAGEGGAITTNDPELAEVCRSITNCGRDPKGPWYHHVRVATNARITEIQAAMLRVQLERLGSQTQRREENAALLNAGLCEIEGLTAQPNSNRITQRAYHLYCFRIDPVRFGCSRAALIEAAEAEGLPLSAGYPLPLYEQPVSRKWFAEHGGRAMPCPVTEDLCKTSGVWLPHQLLLGSEVEVFDILTILRKIKDHAADLDAREGNH